MKKIILAVTVIVIASAGAFLACTKERPNVESGSSKNSNSLGKIAGFDFTLQTNQFVEDLQYTFSISSSDDINAFQNLVDYVRLNTGNNEINPVSIIFYTTDANVAHFLSNDYFGVKSIGVYEYINSKLTHRLFILSPQGTLIEDMNNRKPVSAIVLNDIQFALLHDVKDKFSNASAYHMFISKGYQNINSPDEELSLHQAYYYYSKNSIDPNYRIDLIRVSHVYNYLPPKEQNKGCKAPCTPDPKSDGCIVSGEYIYDCAGVPPRDVEKETSSKSISTGLLSESEAAIIFPLNLAYTLRDSLMIHSNFGRKYINYYYAMNSILTINDYTTLLVDLINIMPSVNLATNKILNPSVYGNDVLISENFATELKLLLDKWKTLHNDTEYKLIVDNVKYDVDQLKNLNVNQILSTYF